MGKHLRILFKSLLLTLVVLSVLGSLQQKRFEHTESILDETPQIESVSNSAKDEDNEFMEFPGQSKSEYAQNDYLEPKDKMEYHLNLSGTVNDFEIIDEIPLFDTRLNKIGYLYVFEFEEYSGYGVILEYHNKYLVNEVAYYVSNPYQDINVNFEKIYLGLNGFCYYENGSLKSATTGKQIGLE